MTAHPSPAALRARLGREKRRLATPADVRALIERGREQRAELERQARVATALGRMEAAVARRLEVIRRTKQPSARARMLGDLADWILEQRELLTDAGSIRTVARARVRQGRSIPAWVPDELAPVYLDPTISEFEAARRARRLKVRGGGLKL